MAAPHGTLQTGENAEGYDKCIRAALGNQWDIALYPPLPVESFGLGTIFARYKDGSIRTFSQNLIVSSLFCHANSKPLELWNDARDQNGRTPLDLDVVISGSIKRDETKQIPLTWPPGSPVTLWPGIHYNYK